MKAIACVLLLSGFGTIMIVMSQNTSSAPARIAGPEWIHAHL
jgi:hypothetical protein